MLEELGFLNTTPFVLWFIAPPLLLVAPIGFALLVGGLLKPSLSRLEKKLAKRQLAKYSNKNKHSRHLICPVCNKQDALRCNSLSFHGDKYFSQRTFHGYEDDAPETSQYISFSYTDFCQFCGYEGAEESHYESVSFYDDSPVFVIKFWAKKKKLIFPNPFTQALRDGLFIHYHKKGKLIKKTETYNGKAVR